jgi:hypothetical protein
MIFYLVKKGHEQPMRMYLKTWGRARSERTRLLHYGRRDRKLEPGVYIFSDVDSLSARGRREAEELWAHLALAPASFRLLNHPRRALRRFDLLQVLHDRGLNSFRAYRIWEAADVETFPVFLRYAGTHSSRFSPLLKTRKDLARALRRAAWRARKPSDLLIVEFCDTSDPAGLFRKYAAFFVAGRVIPRHLVFGRNWILRKPDLLDEAKLLEEHAYLETNPHEDVLRSVFQIAAIDYGRADYSLLDGRPQIWEINTNPIVLLHPDEYSAEHLPAQHWFAHEIEQAFQSLDSFA